MQSRTSTIFPKLCVNGKTKHVTIGPYDVQFVSGKVIEIEVNPLELLISQQEGFDGLIEELKALGKMYKVNHKSILELIADSPNIRSKYFQQHMQLPRYVAEKIIELLIKRKACGIYNSGVRKYEEFARYLQQYVVGKTVRSIETIATTQFRYILPLKSDLAEMSEEMLLEEMRVCEQSRGKHKKEDLAILREMLTAKRKEETENKPRMTDIELLRSIAREDADEDQRTTTPKNKQKHKIKKGTKRR